MYKQKPLQMTIDEHTTMLISKGYRCVGCGSYGSVYATHSGNHVIKVARKMSNEVVDRWFNYAMAVKGKKNPFFPKIKSIIQYGNYQNPDCYYVAVMEQLKPVPIEIDDIVPDLIETAITSRWKTKEELLGIVNNAMFRKNIRIAIRTIGGKKNLPTFMEAIRIIKQVKRRYRADDDMYCENIMMRGEQLVIIDPIC